MPRQANQTSLKPSTTIEETEMLDRLYNRQPRDANGRFIPRPAPRPLEWTDPDALARRDAPKIASRAFEGSGMDLYRQMQVPTAHRPLAPGHAEPKNHFTPMEGPSAVASMTAVDWILAGALAMIIAGSGYLLVVG